MHTTRTLDTVFECQASGIVVLFESDRDDHKRIAGHSRFKIHDLAVGMERIVFGDL